jgi:protein-disulfide isomerase-like protein with CxxC motif
MARPAFAISYDYRCPFANILHQHLIASLKDGENFDVEFVPWTLSQAHRADDGLDVWDDPQKYDQLVALAAGVSVRDQQPEKFLDAHLALFLARHRSGVRLGTLDEVTTVLDAVGVDTAAVRADLDTTRPWRILGESYRRFERYEAFGVPTIVVGDDAVFVRYMNAPTDDVAASTALMDSLLTMIETQPAINEFKHTRLSA